MIFGILQGRLSNPENSVIQSFPTKTWKEEFSIAKELGLCRIEWLFDNYYKFENPIFSFTGRMQITSLMEEFNIIVDSLCADYFRDNPLKNISDIIKSKLLDDIKKLFDSSKELSIKKIMIPYVDHSKINNDEDLKSVIETLTYLTDLSSKYDLIISLETNLKPESYRNLMDGVHSPYLKVNYDSGDSASLGNDLKKEFELLSEYFTQIHIKDRILGGTTVSLGQGDVDFETLFELINKYNLNIPIILQAAREEKGDEVNTAVKNRKFVDNYLQKYNL